MKEFKGTPGKWYVSELDDTFIISDTGKHVLCIEHNGVYNYEELPYNAKLISKAPELLEAIQWFCGRVDKGEVRSKRTYAKFKELIREATELK